ncbi:MAG: 3-oxoacyl-ACP synthase [Alicyclobacillus sp.]|nr:3-oxoacyl-ACP synthase [Alicyclobacillus sp.]
MNKNYVGITGAGAYEPSTILSNHQLEAKLNTSDEWIYQRTGIRERRIADPSAMSTSQMAAYAAFEAIESAHLEPNDIDTGFVYALFVGTQMIHCGAYRTVLVVASETFSRLVDWKDRSTAVLFGDGAGAVILEATQYPMLSYSYFGSDSRGLNLLKAPIGGPISMNGREVFKFGCRTLETLIQKALLDTGLTLDDLALIIPHQANARMFELVVDKMKLPLNKLFVNFVNIEKFGNTSSASIPIALNEAVANSRITRGDIIALVGFGAGLTFGIELITYMGRIR